MRLWIATIACLAACPLAACDDRLAWRHMHPTLERMLDQRRADPYSDNPTFADHRSMRPPPEGTFARGTEEPPFLVDGKFTPRIPYTVTRTMLERGREQFEIICAACHGIAGDSRSVVAEKMELRPPPSLVIERLRSMPVGEMEEVIENGYGLMPSYATAIPNPQARWAVVAYVQALQTSRYASVAALPADIRAQLSREAP